MEPTFDPLNLQRMFFGEIPLIYLVEIGIRIVIMYTAALFMLNLLGKEAARQANPLEQLLIVALGTSTGDSMLYPDVPLVFAIGIIWGVIGLGYVVERAKSHIPMLKKLIDNEPVVLIEEGSIKKDNIKKVGMSKKELYSHLREQGAEYLSQVKIAIFEVSGNLSVKLDTDKKGTTDLFDTENR